MKYQVLVSKTFQQKFYKIEKSIQENIRKSLIELQNDPFRSRPNCDIKLLKDTKPKKYRLRIGEYRIIFLVAKKDIKIIDLIKRETGYSRLE